MMSRSNRYRDMRNMDGAMWRGGQGCDRCGSRENRSNARVGCSFCNGNNSWGNTRLKQENAGWETRQNVRRGVRRDTRENVRGNMQQDARYGSRMNGGSSCSLCGRSERNDNMENGNGCGCNDGQNDCEKLMDQIRAVDFALYELVLYLDVYPDSCEALETYHKLIARRKALNEKFETSCGPLTAWGNRSETSWDWIDKPTPWEYNAP